MSIQSVGRSLFLLFLLFFSTSSAWLGNRAFAQTFKNFDGAVNVFGQFSGTSNGNGVQDKPTDSLGALGTFRQSFKPWLGYEVNYGYTRFAERYAVLPFGVQVQNNLHEVSVAYLVQGPSFLGFQPFGAVGTAALIFLPTSVGGQRYTQQTRVPLLYEFGVNYPILHVAPWTAVAISGPALQDAGFRLGATDDERATANVRTDRGRLFSVLTFPLRLEMNE